MNLRFDTEDVGLKNGNVFKYRKDYSKSNSKITQGEKNSEQLDNHMQKKKGKSIPYTTYKTLLQMHHSSKCKN